MTKSEEEIDAMWGALLSERSLEEERRMLPSMKKREQFAYEGTWERSRSSLIREAKYSAKEQFLVISFHSSPDETYTYFKVPEAVGKGLFEAAKDERSIGAYFAKNIKKNYTFAKLKKKVSTEKPSDEKSGETDSPGNDT